MPGRFTIGIDLGGTNIKGGVLDASGRLVCRQSIETQADQGFEHVFGRLVQLVDDLIGGANVRKGDVGAVGYGVPGPMSHKEGIIFASPNLPGWKNIPLRARFSEAIDLPVTIDNDANAAAYGEFVAGAGKGLSDMVMLTLGTGIGGGVVMGGKLQRGSFDNAGELGHIIVMPNGRPCPCGQRGCLERYGSANAVAERFVEAIEAGDASPLSERIAAGETLTSVDVARAAAEGDALAVRIWSETCLYLAIGCVNIQHTVNPELIVLAGGLIQAGQQLLDPIRTDFQQQAWQIAKDHPRIEFATLGGDAGVIGAAALARAAKNGATE